MSPPRCRKARAWSRLRSPSDRIVVTIEVAGALEVRTFDAKTLRPEGRLRFVTRP